MSIIRLADHIRGWLLWILDSLVYLAVARSRVFSSFSLGMGVSFYACSFGCRAYPELRAGGAVPLSRKIIFRGRGCGCG